MTVQLAKSPSPGTKQSALDAFEFNLADARWLVDLAHLLRNDRRRRMRKELRDRVGEALRVPMRQRASLECLENEQVFVTFLPGSAKWRDALTELNLRPLLRQAVVAACAAVETYVADRVMENYAAAMKLDPIPQRLLDLTMTVEDYRRIERTYERRGWGLRQLVELEVRARSSAAPTVIGELFSMVGHRKVFKAVDERRGLPSGRSARQLEEMRLRRNKIAHEGDRQGRGRASISTDEVAGYLTCSREVVEGIDLATKPGTQKPVR